MNRNKIINAFILMSVLTNMAYASYDKKNCFTIETYGDNSNGSYTSEELKSFVNTGGASINFVEEIKLISGSKTKHGLFNNKINFHGLYRDAFPYPCELQINHLTTAQTTLSTSTKWKLVNNRTNNSEFILDFEGPDKAWLSLTCKNWEETAAAPLCFSNDFIKFEFKEVGEKVEYEERTIRLSEIKSNEGGV